MRHFSTEKWNQWFQCPLPNPMFFPHNWWDGHIFRLSNGWFGCEMFWVLQMHQTLRRLAVLLTMGTPFPTSWTDTWDQIGCRRPRCNKCIILLENMVDGYCWFKEVQKGSSDSSLGIVQWSWHKWNIREMKSSCRNSSTIATWSFAEIELNSAVEQLEVFPLLNTLAPDISRRLKKTWPKHLLHGQFWCSTTTGLAIEAALPSVR